MPEELVSAPVPCIHFVLHTSIEIRRRDDVVAGVGQCRNGHELRRLSRRGGDSGHAALEGRHPFLKDIDGGLKFFTLGPMHP